MIVASAPGETFFFGEHSVVYGKTALATAVGKRTTVSLKEAKNIKISSRLGEFSAKIKNDKLVETKHGQALAPFKNGIQRVFDHYGKSAGFEATISSEIQPGSGMASSAAVSAALIKALTELLGEKTKERRLIELVYGMELDIQKRGSRTGPSCAVLGGVVKIRGKNISRVEKIKQLPIVLGHTGTPSLTSETTARVKKLLEKHPRETKLVFETIDNIAKKGEKLLKKGDSEQIGELMNMNHGLLSALGVSSPKLDQLVNAARKKAYGAKLSGGGGGGTMVALCSQDAQKKVAADIKKSGGTPIATKMGVEGARIEKK